jgi:hypothetical protein
MAVMINIFKASFSESVIFIKKLITLKQVRAYMTTLLHNVLWHGIKYMDLCHFCFILLNPATRNKLQSTKHIVLYHNMDDIRTVH